MNTIERVARAIRRSQYSPELWEPEEIESMVEEGASDFDRIAARAAIEALREPDEAMIEAGGKNGEWTDRTWPDEEPAIFGQFATQVWQAMIDSILNTDTTP